MGRTHRPRSRRGAGQGVRGGARPRRRRPRGARRHRARAARAERRRQDDRRPHPDDDAASPTGAGARARASTWSRDAPTAAPRIGLAGQYAAVDENLTGRENLRMVGRLNHLSAGRIGAARRRAARAVRPHRRRRPAARRPTPAACAAGSTWAPRLVHRPPVLFLDEPTTGLDPQSRTDLWDVVRRAGRRRHDRAAHHPVPRGGRPPGGPDRGDRPRHGAIAEGTAAELKAPPRRHRGGARMPDDGEAADGRAACCDRSARRGDGDGAGVRLQRRATARATLIATVRDARRGGAGARRPRPSASRPWTTCS